MTLPHLLQIVALLGLVWLFAKGLAIIAGADSDDRIRQIAGRERSK